MSAVGTKTCRVLIVTSELHGGSATYVTQLASILEEQAVVAASFFPNGRDLERDFASRPVFAMPERYRSIKGLLRNALRLRAAVRRFEPDVIYTNTVFPLVCVCLLRLLGSHRRPRRVVHVLHSIFTDRVRCAPLRGVASVFERIAGLFVDVAVAPSAYMKRVGDALYGPEKTLLLRNSLNAAQERQLLAVRATRDTSPRRAAGEPHVLVFVGRADRQKGLDILLPAFALARKSRPLRLMLIGLDRDEMLRCWPEASELAPESVECLGWQRDTTPAYARADLFVMPSRWEAFGLTLLEARLAGLFCIGSDVDAIPEQLSPRDGLLFAPLDAGTLAATIVSAVDQLATLPAPPSLEGLPRFAEHREQQLALLRAQCGLDRRG